MGDKFWLGVGAVFVAGTVWSMVGGTQRTPKFDDVSAKMACEDAVGRTLKAPSTAVFSGHGDTTIVAKSGGEWGVDGHVDAQNSFGAHIRSRYSCALIVTGTSYSVLDARTY